MNIEQNLRGRFESLFSLRKDQETEWDEIETFIAPIRGGQFFSDQSSEYEVQWTHPEIFDSTAIDAADRLAKAMNSYLTNASTKWFEFNFRDTDLNINQEAKEWLEECGTRVYEALIDSNFNGEMSSCYLDLVDFGNAFLMEEVENELKYDGISFQSVPIREGYFEPDHNDQIKYFYRHLQWTAVQIVDKFGADSCTDDIVSMAQKGEAQDTKISVIFCIWERDEYKEISEDRPVVAPDDRQWGWCYLLREGDHKFSEGGYYEQPAYITRWEKTSGSYWGFGPSHIALPTVKSVNKCRELIKIRATKEIDPLIITEERNVIGEEIDFSSGVATVKDINGIKYLFPNSNFSIASQDLKDDQSLIRSIYFADDLVLKDSPQMTATEVMERTERLIKLLGGTFGRLQMGLLNPVLERTFNILWRAGELPVAPQVVIDSDMRDILDITYTGALARAQKSEDVMQTSRWVNIQIERAVQTENMSILDVVDWDELSRGEADLMGVPAKYLKGAEEVDEERKARAEAQARQQEAALQQAENDAQIAGNEAQAPMQ